MAQAAFLSGKLKSNTNAILNLLIEMLARFLLLFLQTSVTVRLKLLQGFRHGKVIVVSLFERFKFICSCTCVYLAHNNLDIHRLV